MVIKPKVYDELEKLCILSPIPFYWTDSNGVIAGVNKYCFDLANNLLTNELIGKSAYDIYTPESAALVDKHIKEVMKARKVIAFEEELVDLITGEKRWYVSSRSPLFEEDEVIGIVGCITEITDTKEKDRLKLENQMQKIEQQEKFQKIVEQVVHDIGSPLLTMQIVLPQCNALPEDKRDILKTAAARIHDISSNLLTRFRPNQDKGTSETKRSKTLINTEISEIIAQKRYEYNELSIDFVLDITQVGYFAFINIDASAFKRMLSNLINNAVDAFENRMGEVVIHLDAINNQVQIIVEDNGKGMPEPIKEKILNNIAITSGKDNGHGIGFSQIRDTLAANNGKLAIETEMSKGTKIILTFPQVEQPSWICNIIELTPDDLIIILDDDLSIHGAWETRFEKAAPAIERRHFEQGAETVEFINKLSTEQKEKLFLLTDYELLKQELHGLDVVNKTGIKRSVLVTSHHNNQAVRDLAKLTNTKILPKLLTAEVPIIISDHLTVSSYESDTDQVIKQAGLVIVDDDKHLVNSLVRYILKNKNTDTYHNPQEFLKKIEQYPKCTTMLITHKFKNYEVNGFDLLKQLHENGFNKLYLFVQNNFDPGNIPGYVQVVMKNDVDAIENLI